MIKIVFVIGCMEIGGVQTSLINLLNKIDYEKFDVSLIAFSIADFYKDLIPSEVKVVKMPQILELISTPSDKVKRKGKLAYAFRKGLAFCCKYLSANFVYSILFAFVNTKGLNYDLAVSYNNNVNIKSVYFGSNKFVLKKIKAKRKISWLHVDYKAMKLNNKTNNKEYAEFDQIICVSKDTERKFLECCPQFENKTGVIYNIIDTEKIKKLSVAEDVEKKSIFTVATVCRLDKNKNVEECIRTAAVLNKKGMDFTWLIVGDGPERKKLETMSRELEVSDKVCFLGYKSNPYPYMKNSDVFVSASLSESFGLSIYESLILGVPVVAKRYDAIDEVIRGTQDGYVIEGNEEDFASAIGKIAERKKLSEEKTDSYALFAEERNQSVLLKLEEMADA